MPSYERYLPFHLYIPFLSPLRELYVMLQLFIVKLLICTFQLIILFAEFSFLLLLNLKIKHSTSISYQETLDIYWVTSTKQAWYDMKWSASSGGSKKWMLWLILSKELRLYIWHRVRASRARDVLILWWLSPQEWKAGWMEHLGTSQIICLIARVSFHVSYSAALMLPGGLC